MSSSNSDNNRILVLSNITELPALVPLDVLRQQQQMENNPKEGSDVEWGDSSDNSEQQKFKRTSGPRTNDPYSSDESWFWPITIAIAIFLPVLFCLCRVR